MTGASGADGTAISRRGLALLLGVGSVSLLAACAEDGGSGAAAKGATASPALTVHKEASCGCCGGWVEHAEREGFTVTVVDTDSLGGIWSRHDIPLDLQSCHLATTEEGDLFVGHVPARHVREYLADPPAGARGLSVPAMPAGTPGMEQGDRFDPYEILLITDGEPTVFAEVTKPSQQV